MNEEHETRAGSSSPGGLGSEGSAAPPTSVSIPRVPNDPLYENVVHRASEAARRALSEQEARHFRNFALTVAVVGAFGTWGLHALLKSYVNERVDAELRNELSSYQARVESMVAEYRDAERLKKMAYLLSLGSDESTREALALNAELWESPDATTRATVRSAVTPLVIHLTLERSRIHFLEDLDDVARDVLLSEPDAVEIVAHHLGNLIFGDSRPMGSLAKTEERYRTYAAVAADPLGWLVIYDLLIEFKRAGLQRAASVDVQVAALRRLSVEKRASIHRTITNYVQDAATYRDASRDLARQNEVVLRFWRLYRLGIEEALR